ncbi:MAG: 5'/3'-nucleotidase SurE [Bacillota bacterium]
MKLSILLTNDDGFHADGLQTLYHCLKESASVTVVAPDRERSAVGHGITVHHPLRAISVLLDNCTHWMIDGTPSDCVKLAIERLMPGKSPDLIISGINRGPNLGFDVLYSGTVSAAIEGTLYKIPSIALSLAGFSKLDFTPAALFVRENLWQLKELATQATLNLNFPVTDTLAGFQGVRLTRLGIRIYQNVFEERKDPRGQTYYWMGGEPAAFEQEQNSDIKAVDEGYISITPLNIDLTDNSFLENNTKLTMKL